MAISAQTLGDSLRKLGVNLQYFNEIPSTNTCAKEAPIAGGAWELFITERQTAGYGQYQRLWTSPPGNIAMSLLVRSPNVYKNDRYKIPLVVGIAVRRAVSAFVLSGLTLKWPNDIYLDGQKMGGILTENTSGENLVIGIGLNVNSTLEDFDESVRQERMTLREKLGRELSREELVCSIVKNIQIVMKELKQGQWALLIQEYRRYSFLTGKEVSTSDGISGKVVNIANDGQLQMVLADKSFRLIAAGDVSVKPIK